MFLKKYTRKEWLHRLYNKLKKIKNLNYKQLEILDLDTKQILQHKTSAEN